MSRQSNVLEKRGGRPVKEGGAELSAEAARVAILSEAMVTIAHAEIPHTEPEPLEANQAPTGHTVHEMKMNAYLPMFPSARVEAQVTEAPVVSPVPLATTVNRPEAG